MRNLQLEKDFKNHIRSKIIVQTFKLKEYAMNVEGKRYYYGSLSDLVLDCIELSRMFELEFI